MTLAADEQGTDLISDMRAARDRTVVSKTDILTLRSKIPSLRIFVFEGDDDKIVYHAWISRCAPDIAYEPFCCKGKEKVLALRDSLALDKSNTIDGIYFFVDRDFDDLQGCELGDRTYLTPCYALENYLVRSEVLDLVLQNEFHLNGNPDHRRTICEIYENLFSSFIRMSSYANERIYVSRKANVEFSSRLPDDCKKIAKIHVDRLDETQIDPNTWLSYKEPVSEQDEARFIAEFRELEPRCRYRGKFFLDFFKRWLDKLAEDYRAEQPKLFARQAGSGRVRSAEFTLGSFSIKSPLPEGLADFIRSSSIPQAA